MMIIPNYRTESELDYLKKNKEEAMKIRKGTMKMKIDKRMEKSVL